MTLRAVAEPSSLGVVTFANLPSAASNPSVSAFVSDWGANGTTVRSNGTRWIPTNGQTVLKRMGAPVTGITNSETIVAQVQVPIGTFQSGDTILIRFAGGKSG